jgi:hypothetical protein
MAIEIKEPFDFIDKLFDFEGEEVDLIFSAGEYEQGVFNIGCDEQFETVRVEGRDLTRLVDSYFNLCANQIEASNYLFDSPAIAGPVFAAQAKDVIVINSCAWIFAYLDQLPGLSILHLEPGALTSSIDISDCWFIANFAVPGHEVLSTRTMTEFTFNSIEISGSAFIKNNADIIFGAYSGNRITLKDCFILQDDDRPIFLAARTKGASIEFKRCIIVAPSFAHIVSQWASDGEPNDFNPAVFEDCQIFLSEEDSLPDDVLLSRSTYQKIDKIQDDTLEAWVIDQEAVARSGVVPNAKELGESLGLG